MREQMVLADGPDGYASGRDEFGVALVVGTGGRGSKERGLNGSA
ncbi:hypothetical protein [Streptomyces prasinus]